jgi:hypothetical protein
MTTTDESKRSTKEQIALCLHRAQPTPGLMTPSLTIVIDEEIRRDHSSEGTDHRRNLFRQEARALALALRGSLPGGTVDALLVELLDSKRSEFVVAMSPIEKHENVPSPGISDERFQISITTGVTRGIWAHVCWALLLLAPTVIVMMVAYATTWTHRRSIARKAKAS